MLVLVALIGHGVLKPLGISAVLLLFVSLLSNITGGCLNMWRWLAPAIVSTTFLSDFWIFLVVWLVAPLLAIFVQMIWANEICVQEKKDERTTTTPAVQGNVYRQVK